MSDIIIGRKAEQEILRQRIESKSPELIAIYGRRRIGKTFNFAVSDREFYDYLITRTVNRMELLAFHLLFL